MGLEFPFINGLKDQKDEYFYKKIASQLPEKDNTPELLYGDKELMYYRYVNEGMMSAVGTSDLPQGSPVSVMTFGAKGDGITDDTARCQAALDAGAGGTVVFPKPYTYRVSNLNIPDGTEMILQGGATIKHENVGAVLTAAGTTSVVKTNVSVNVVQNGNTITAPGHPMVAGDTFRLSCDTLFDASSTFIKHGELLTVDSVAGDVITTTDPVQSSAYTVAANAYVQRMIPIKNVRIRGGGKILGMKSAAMGQFGIDIRFGKNCLIQGITTENIDRRHIYFGDCQDTWADGVTCRWAVDNTQAYGVSIANCTQDSGVRFSNFYYVRHSVTTNNEALYPGISRRNRFHFNTVHSTSVALGGSMGGGDAIDTHTAAEDFWIENNNVISSTGQGINLECRSGRIIGNKVKNCAGLGISAHNESDLSGRIDIMFNHVSYCAGGIYARTGARGSTTGVYEQMTISFNVVNNCTGIAVQIGWNSATTAVMKGVQYTNNTLYANTGTYAFYVTNAENVINRDNKVVSGTATLFDGTTSTVTDHENYITRTIASDAITITPTARFVNLATEGAAATDNLSSILPLTRGQIITLRSGSNGQDITILNSGNIRYISAFTLDAARDTITLFCDATNWVEMSRGDHPAA